MKNIIIKIINLIIRFIYFIQGYNATANDKCLHCKKAIYAWELVCSSKCWQDHLNKMCTNASSNNKEPLYLKLNDYIELKNCDLEKLLSFQCELNDEINSRKVKCPTCRCRIFPGKKCMCCENYPTITDGDDE